LAMNRKNWWKLGLALLALAGMLVPAPLLHAAGEAPVAPLLGNDVALAADGALRGQLVSAQGRGLPGECVTVSHGGHELVSTVTGPDGYFEVRGLRGGVLNISAGEATALCRAWTAAAAPPNARNQVLLVAGQSQTLGQGGLRALLTNPWVIAGIVAAAIAIPVGIHNYNKNHDDPASP